MSPETIKVSSCCGYPLVVVNESEGTMHYECNKCALPCDGVSDCADCFPQNFAHKHANQTVPICDKHYNEMNPSFGVSGVGLSEELVKWQKNKSPRCPHCDDMGGMDTESHKDCELCCGCKKIDTRKVKPWKCEYEDCKLDIKHHHKDYNSRGIELEQKEQSTDDKIVEAVRIALRENYVEVLRKLSDILQKRAELNSKLEQLLK